VPRMFQKAAAKLGWFIAILYKNQNLRLDKN
jgi:hypothetical protein